MYTVKPVFIDIGMSNRRNDARSLFANSATVKKMIFPVAAVNRYAI